MKYEIKYLEKTNLKLLDKIRNSKKSLGQIAREMGFANSSRVSQVLQNLIPVSEKTKKRFANYFNCQVEDIFENE